MDCTMNMLTDQARQGGVKSLVFESLRTTRHIICDLFNCFDINGNSSSNRLLYSKVVNVNGLKTCLYE